jgi:hypothetical protein
MDETATDDEVVESTAIEEPEMEEPSQELVHSPRQGEVMMPLDGDQLVESFDAYQKLRGRLLVPDDYQSAGGGRRFVKKSGWRKIATAFGLNIELVRSVVERADDGSPTRAEVWARAIAPNGRFSDGDGYCDVSEDRFSGPRGNKSKLENDLRATAATRATNRAISNLVGMGEVSAEEMAVTRERSGPQHGPEATGQNTHAFGAAFMWLARSLGVTDEDAIEDAALRVGNAINDQYGYVPQAAIAGFLLAAKTLKGLTEANTDPAPNEEDTPDGDDQH